MAVDQATSIVDAPASSLASQLPQVFRWLLNTRSHQKPCGSQPAGEGNRSVSNGLAAPRIREQARSHRGLGDWLDCVLRLGTARPFAITLVMVRQWQHR